MSYGFDSRYLLVRKVSRVTILILSIAATGVLIAGGVYLFVHRANYLSGTTVSIESAGAPAAENTDNSGVPSQDSKPSSSTSASLPIAEENSTNSVKDENEKPLFSFAVIGDTQRFDPGDTNGPFQRAVQSISRFDVDFVMANGDLVSSCSKDNCAKKLTDWKNTLGALAAKTYPVQGNHDRTGKEASDSAWQDVFSLPANGPEDFKELAYSFDYENAHFVFLASDSPEEHVVNKTQRDWLRDDLASSNKKYKFIFFHEPAFPVSSKKDESLDAEKKDRDALWKILDEFSVTAVFSGHEHIHSRKRIDGSVFPGARHSIYQFVVGNTDSFNHDAPKAGEAEYSYRGTHFAIVSVSDKKITVNVYTVDGAPLDTFEFSP